MSAACTRALLLAFAGLFAVACGGRARWNADIAPDILLVTIDTLRADRLGSYGYRAAQTPTLDAIAARGRRFERAWTVTPLTLPAHASLMTGLFPPKHGVRDNGGFYLAGEFDTLAERLRAAGYRTGAFVGSFVLDARWGLDQGFETYADDFDLSGGGQAGMDDIQHRAADVVDRALGWWRALPSNRGSTFTWVHFYDPHTPYDAPDPFASRFPRTTSGAYDAEIAYTDAQVGRLIEELRRTGRDGRTVVTILADHGEALGDHGEQTHGFFIYESTVRIPLIIAGPGVEPTVVTDPVRIIDVMPTLLYVAQTSIDPQGGRDLLSPASPRDEVPVFSETLYPRYHYGWSDLAALSDGRFKFIAAPRPELYDLQHDPHETRNLFEAQPQASAAMAAALTRLRSETSTTLAAQRPVDADVEQRLQSLGYIGTGTRRLDADAGTHADPKDKIAVYNELKSALLDQREGRAEEAIARIRRAVAAEPAMTEGHTMLGSALAAAARWAEARDAYRRALALDPDHRGATFNLALAYKNLGKWEEARLGFERARDQDPRDGKARWHLADLSMQRGDFARARTILEESLQLDVDRPVFNLKLAECLIEVGNLDAARVRLDEALAVRPTLARAHYARALVFERVQDTVAAQREYEIELEQHPETWAAAFNLGKLLLPTTPRTAADRFASATARAPDFAPAWMYLAKAWLDAGNLAEAESAARQGLNRKPAASMQAFGHYILADIFSRRGETSAAAREAALAARAER